MVTSWKLYDAIRGMASGGDKASTTTAVYIGRDSDGRDIVRLKGSGIATPVNGSMSASAKEGDTLSVDVSNGRLSVVGNLSDPGVGGEYVSEAVGASESAVREDMGQISTVAEGAAQTARGAASIANATAQHFWVDGQGVHVTQVTQDVFLEEPSGPNQLSNANGILLRDGRTYLASFATGGMDIYDGTGNGADDIVAQFTSEGARVGYPDSKNVLITSEGTYFNGDLGRSVGRIESVAVAHVEYSSRGIDSKVVEPGEPYEIVINKPLYPLSDGVRATVSLYWDTGQQVVGHRNFSFSAAGSQTFGGLTVSLAVVSDANFSLTIESDTSIELVNEWTYAIPGCFIRYPVAAYSPSYVFGSGSASGEYAFSAGTGTESTGEASFSEGVDTSASGEGAHAEGKGTTASGNYSHAEGYDTVASSITAHAEGDLSQAQANASHAQNEGTIAAKRSQTALGKYNVEDTAEGSFGQYAVIVGNGTGWTNRSNALTVDWSGNVACGTVNGIDIAAAVAGVTVFKGELSSQATLEGADYEAGWYWLVTASGTYAGNHCEPGDMVYAVADKGTAYSDDDFAVVQANQEALTNEEIEALLQAADA